MFTQVAIYIQCKLCQCSREVVSICMHCLRPKVASAHMSGRCCCCKHAALLHWRYWLCFVIVVMHSELAEVGQECAMQCRQFECPTHQGEIYKLPTAVQEQVNQLYQRDIARMAGEGKDTKGMEDEYKTFLAELGGKDPRELGGSG